MAKVLVAYNNHGDEAKIKDFKQGIIKCLCSIKSEAFKTTKNDITFVCEAANLEADKVKDYSLVIALEEVDGVKIGVGRVRQWKNANNDLRIILIVDKAKKSSGKLNALYEMGYYDALLSSEFRGKVLERLILVPRTEKEAYEHYGLMYYTDYSKLKKASAEKPLTELVEEVKKEQTEQRRVSQQPYSGPDRRSGKDRRVVNLGNPNGPDRRKGGSMGEVTEKGAGDKKHAPAASNENLYDDGLHSDFDKADVSSKVDYERHKGTVQPGLTEKQQSDSTVPEDISSGAGREEKPSKNAKGEQKGKTAQQDERAVTADADGKTKQKRNEKEGAPEQKNAKKPDDNSGTASDSYEAADDYGDAADNESMLEMLKHESLSSYLNRISYIYDYDDDSDGEDDELLNDGISEENFDASDYLVPATEDDYYQGDVDWFGVDVDSIKRYIKYMERKAFNPITIEPQPSRESEILEEILDYYTSIDTVWIANLESGILNERQFQHHLWERVNTYTELTDEQKEYIYGAFLNYMWGYDILTPLINDPSISDIALVAYNNIQVKKYGMRYFSTITFRTPAHFTNFINHIVRLNHVDLSDKRPNKTFMDTSTSASARMRFVYSREYINASGEPSLVIRKVPTKKYSLDDLVRLKMMDYNTAAYILNAVISGKSIIWTGTMASGKTSQMNTFLDFIPHNMRGLVAQENEELFSNTHPLLQFQDIRPSEDGEILYDLRYLLRFGLLMDFQYITIGEIKGGESEQFVEAVYTNCICWASVHSTGAREALPRIATLAVTEHFTEAEQLRKLSQGVDLVIYLEDFIVREIVEVDGWDEENKCTIYTDVDINIPQRFDGKKSRAEARQEKKKKKKTK